ncbi:MAG: hypothetical protein HZB16_08165 [Armatimonadetes bacterium]|nr:hypothetical protein [Armatimonadota bacterium]
MKPAELTYILLAVVQIAMLVWILALLRRGAREPARTPDFEALSRGLEGPFKRLAAEWAAEHARLAQQTANVSDLVARLTRLQFQSSLTGPEAEPAADGTEQASSAARQDARRRLMAGEGVEDVAEATGLPDGEVRVLASVLKRGG